jgi:hypothetical protein
MYFFDLDHKMVAFLAFRRDGNARDGHLKPDPAQVGDQGLDGQIATEGTECFEFCRDLPDDPAEDARGSEFYTGADMWPICVSPSTFSDPNRDPVSHAGWRFPAVLVRGATVRSSAEFRSSPERTAVLPLPPPDSGSGAHGTDLA